MDKIENYLSDLNSEVQALMDDEKLLPVPAFTQYVTDGIAEKTGVDEHYAVHCLMTDRSNRVLGEIHGYGISANQEVLTLYYSVYDPTLKEATAITANDFDRGINRMQGFYDLCIRGTHIGMNEDLPEYEVLKFVYDNLSSIVTVRLCLISNFLINKYKIKRIRIDGKNVMADVWDINKICANLNSESDHVAIDIDFMNEDRYSMYQLPYIEMNSENYGYKCLSTMFPAKLLYKLYEDHNTGLLMNNVRFFLGFKRGKNDTNSGIRKTLKEENEMFLAYNNGITAIAKGIDVTPNKGETKLENEEGASNAFISTGIINKIFDFQIVNGGQTTASIFTAKKLERDINLLGVYVLVKLIVLDEDSRNKITDISRYSNTQNKVKLADYSSNNSFNTEMERLSRRTLIPNPDNEPIFWFYERVRGQYKIELNNRTLKSSQEAFKRMFHPDCKFDKELLAKVWLSWNGAPYTTANGASKCYEAFLATIDDGNYVRDESYYKQSVALFIIYRHLLNYAKVAGFGTAKAPAAAYTMGYLNYITLGNIDLFKIWELQGVPESVGTTLNNLCERIKAELEVGARSANRSVLDAAKNKNTYQEIKNRDLGFSSDSIRDILNDN